MKHTFKKFIAFLLVLTALTCTFTSFSTVHAASNKTTTNTPTYASQSISSFKINTSSNYYIVQKSDAVLRDSKNIIYKKRATFTKNSLIKVNGSSGNFYTIKVTENNQNKTYYIKKSDVKKAPSSYNASICYTNTSSVLRSSPYSEGKTITSLAKGTVLKYLGSMKNAHKNNWYFCMTTDGKLGYVYAPNVTKTSKITLSLTECKNMLTNKVTKFTYKVSPSGISGISYHSSKPDIVKINSKGEAVAYGADDVTITAKLNNVISVSVNTNVSLNVKCYRQTKNYTCSAAATLAVAQYLGKGLNDTDTKIYKDINGYVYLIRDKLNKYNKNTYCYKTYKSFATYEKDIRKSLAANRPVIVRIKFSKKYFNYPSNGHYSTIVGLYEKNGEVWAKMVDSFAHNHKSNSYTNPSTGEVNVPLKELYNYGSYDGSLRYVILSK